MGWSLRSHYHHGHHRNGYYSYAHYLDSHHHGHHGHFGSPLAIAGFGVGFSHHGRNYSISLSTGHYYTPHYYGYGGSNLYYALGPSYGYYGGYHGGYGHYSHYPYNLHRPHQTIYYNAYGTGIHYQTVWRKPYHYRRYGHHYRYHRPHFGYHYYRHRVYRPYYYSSPGYGWYYDDEEGYSRQASEALNKSYKEGYRDGYEDGGEKSPYHDKRERTPYTPLERSQGRTFNEYSKLMQSAQSLFRSGDYKTAAAYYKDACIANPLSIDAKRGLAQSAFASGRFGLAAFALRRAISLDSEMLSFKGEYDPRAAYDDPVLFRAQLERLKQAADKDAGDADLQVLAAYFSLADGDVKAAAAGAGKGSQRRQRR